MNPKQPYNVWLLLTFALITLTITACYQTTSTQCHYSSDCESNEYCRAGQCVPASNQPTNIKTERPQQSEFDDIFDDTSNNDVTESLAQPCPEGSLPRAGDIVMNEFLVNVPPGMAGDANGDGVRHPHDDEFVELVNISDHQLDISGVKIQNATSTKHTFPRFCLDAGHAIVIFGGIESGAKLPTAPGSHTMIAHSRFMFNNDQGTIVVRGANNGELLRVNYERSPPQALTLSPELHGTRFVPHNSVGSSALFSPGTCSNSQSIIDGCAVTEEHDPDSPAIED